MDFFLFSVALSFQLHSYVSSSDQTPMGKRGKELQGQAAEASASDVTEV